MPTPDFRFEVEEAFNIAGRGTAVIGRLVSGNTTTGEPLCLHADGSVARIEEASVEFMYREGSRPARPYAPRRDEGAGTARFRATSLRLIRADTVRDNGRHSAEKVPIQRPGFWSLSGDRSPHVPGAIRR